MPIICLPKDKMPVPMAMQRAKDETALPTTAFMVEAARAEAIPILPEKATALPLERICSKTRLTNGECGQNGRQCAIPKLRERNKGRMPCPSTQTQDTMEARLMTAIGKEDRSHLAKGKPAKGDKLV